MPLNLTRGAARELVGAADVPTLRRAGVLVEDTRRERPRWFDGRFLAARDLIRDQQYFLTREADLGRAAGSGVATGLHVTEGSGPQVARMSAPATASRRPASWCCCRARSIVALTNIASAEQLSARFGLSRIAAAAAAQPHRPVRAGAAAGRVHRQPDRRLPVADHRPAHGRGRRRGRSDRGGAGAVAATTAPTTRSRHAAARWRAASS